MNKKNNGWKILFLIFLLISSCLGISAFIMSFKAKGEGYGSDNDKSYVLCATDNWTISPCTDCNCTNSGGGKFERLISTDNAWLKSYKRLGWPQAFSERSDAWQSVLQDKMNISHSSKSLDESTLENVIKNWDSWDYPMKVARSGKPFSDVWSYLQGIIFV